MGIKLILCTKCAFQCKQRKTNKVYRLSFYCTHVILVYEGIHCAGIQQYLADLNIILYELLILLFNKHININFLL